MAIDTVSQQGLISSSSTFAFSTADGTLPSSRAVTQQPWKIFFSISIHPSPKSLSSNLAKVICIR